MARMSGAEWWPVRNYTNDGQERVLGVVVHIMQGTLEGSHSWFDNSRSQASSHFGVSREGKIYQFVDTADRAWAQGSGNRDYLSIENEGYDKDGLSAAQVKANAKILKWAHDKYKVPFALADKVGEKGLGYHKMGGAAWGGHPCPGAKAISQLGDIVKAAKPAKPAPHYAAYPGDGFFRLGKKHALVKAMGKAIIKAGYKGQYTPTEEFTRADLKAYAWFQRKLGYSGAAADGYPGKASWEKLKVPQV